MITTNVFQNVGAFDVKAKNNRLDNFPVCTLSFINKNFIKKDTSVTNLDFINFDDWVYVVFTPHITYGDRGVRLENKTVFGRDFFNEYLFKITRLGDDRGRDIGFIAIPRHYYDDYNVTICNQLFPKAYDIFCEMEDEYINLVGEDNCKYDDDIYFISDEEKYF